MEAKELNLEPVREFIHDLTYDGAYHPKEISALLRKMIIEFSLLSLWRIESGGDTSSETCYYVQTLESLADKFDKIEQSKYIL